MLDLAKKSPSGRFHMFKERVTQYQAAKPENRNTVRVNFYNDIGKAYDFNARMATNLRVARDAQQEISDAVDTAFVQTMKDIFMLIPKPQPAPPRRARRR